MMDMRRYCELAALPSFEERFRYLMLGGEVARETFGFERYLNQQFYKSQEWRRVRDHVILRDCGCDLGSDGHEIFGKAVIHHMNPITVSDVLNCSELLLNPDFLITTTHSTHNAIHYGDESAFNDVFVERKPNDTAPWRQIP